MISDVCFSRSWPCVIDATKLSKGRWIENHVIIVLVLVEWRDASRNWDGKPRLKVFARPKHRAKLILFSSNQFHQIEAFSLCVLYSDIFYFLFLVGLLNIFKYKLTTFWVILIISIIVQKIPDSAVVPRTSPVHPLEILCCLGWRHGAFVLFEKEYRVSKKIQYILVYMCICIRSS